MVVVCIVEKLKETDMHFELMDDNDDSSKNSIEKKTLLEVHDVGD